MSIWEEAKPKPKARPKSPTTSEVKEILETEWTKWCAEHGSPKALKKRIHEQLDKNVQTILLSLMGFENRWHSGRWEIDHCNGRAGGSIVGDYLKKHCLAAATEWLDRNIGTLTDPPKAELVEVRKEYVNTYREELRRQVRRLAEGRAEAKAREMVESLDADGSDLDSSESRGTSDG